MGSGSSKKSSAAKADADGDKNKKKKSIIRKSNDGSYDDNVTNTRQPPKGIRKHVASDRRKSDDVTRQLVVLESENLALSGDWELEKGVDSEIKLTDVSYPPPRPSKPITDTSSFSAVDFEVIMNNMNDPKLAGGSIEDVAARLTADYSTEIAKVRALTTWMSCQKIRTRAYGNDAKPGTVLGYMKQIKELQGTFAGLLALLCRAIDIPCVIIKGIYKSHCHQVGEDDVSNSKCTWNAVHVDGNWQLVHPYLMCTPLSTQTCKDNWTQIETSVVQQDQKPGVVLNTFFFAPKPSDFLYFCLPDDSMSNWQLTETKTHYKTFLKSPFLRPAFFSSKMQLVSEHKSVLLSEGGRCNIKMQCQQENVNDLELMYELYSNDPEFEKKEEWGDLVVCGRNEDTWNIQIKFPVAGTFKVALFAKLEDWFFWIGDFKIVCGESLIDYVATPAVPKEIGYGPSTGSEEAGLLSPSHDGGIVFYKPNEEHIIKFLTNEKVLLSHEIESTGSESEDLQHYCKMMVRKSEIDFIINLPSSGEFALRIYKVDELGERQNVCNYLFIDSDDGRKRENVFQRKARVNMRQTTAGHDIETLENAVQKFDHVKLPHDDDYQRGERRLKYLKLKKGLRDGRMRRHEGTLCKAVDDAENSRFQAALEPNIQRAREILESLQSLDIHCHPVQQMDQKTISEIANFNNPPHDVHNTMMATYLLLGEDRQFLQKWGNIQALLRRQGKEGVKYRVNGFRDGEMPNKSTVQQVQKLHDSVPKSYIVSASLSAAAFYDWVSGVLSYLNNTSQNATDPDDSFEADDMYGHDDLYDVRQPKDKMVADDGNISQDEGFLDSPEMETSTRVGTGV
ncbi:hillarin-like [Ruditapes philippinarum]|uniref:hillarin-like n=1 Tax=Ruditapes philippinarum TaxID=129788 RepID=UPI00295AE94A|nr:hillarin-like [Ruditapes philippinarum]